MDITINTISESNRQLLAEIVNHFSSIGMPLEYFEEEDDMRELWQFDGDLDGAVVQFNLGINGHGHVSIFGDIDLPNGEVIEITSPLKDWMIDMPGWIAQHVK